jgi:hypothetical protein
VHALASEITALYAPLIRDEKLPVEFEDPFKEN